jgi:hypothetical protein
VAFEGVGSMPMARIREVRVDKQAVVDVELQRRSRNKVVMDAVAASERHARHAAAEGARSASHPVKCSMQDDNHEDLMPPCCLFWRADSH